MENDERKCESVLADSSFLLTNWLLKYKLDNISYLSAPSVFNTHLSKSPRKGGIFESRDIIRPTVQLFKSIKLKTKKRNDSPSPQRKPKACSNLSPTKEINKIFNHKTSSEVTLNAYKKLFTYGKMKHDKMSRDKIESAVALFRQREQEKETSVNKHAPEKQTQRKKLDNKEANIGKKFVKKQKKNKSPAEKQVKLSKNSKTEQLEVNEKLSKDDNCQILSSNRKNKEDININKKNEELKSVKKSEENNIQLELASNKDEYFIKKKIEKQKQVGSIKAKSEDIVIKKGENIDVNKTEKYEKNNLLNKKNKQPKQIKDTEVAEVLKEKTNERMALINSLKSKYSSPELTSVKNLHEAKKLASADYIIIKPAIIGDTNETDKSKFTAKTEKPIGKKSVEDLLREYRLKYRNMIRLK